MEQVTRMASTGDRAVDKLDEAEKEDAPVVEEKAEESKEDEIKDGKREGASNEKKNEAPRTAVKEESEPVPKKGRKQRYRGVYMCGKKWKVQIQYAGKQRYLGSYADQKTAALVYDDAARTLHGTSAITNFDRPTPSTSRKTSNGPQNKWSPAMANNHVRGQQYYGANNDPNVTKSPLDTLVAVATVAPQSPHNSSGRGGVANPFAIRPTGASQSPKSRRSPHSNLPHDSLGRMAAGGGAGVRTAEGQSPRQGRLLTRKEMEEKALAAAHAQIEAEAVARYEQAKLELAAIRRRGHSVESFDNLTALATLPSGANSSAPSPTRSPHPYSFSNPRLSVYSGSDRSGILGEWSPLTPLSEQILSNGVTPQASPHSRDALIPVDVERRSPRGFNQIPPQDSYRPNMRFPHGPMDQGLPFGKMSIPYPNQGREAYRAEALAGQTPERLPPRLLPHGDVMNQGRHPDLVPAGSSSGETRHAFVNDIRQTRHDLDTSPRNSSYPSSSRDRSPVGLVREQNIQADAGSNLYSSSYVDFLRKRKTDPEPSRSDSERARKRTYRPSPSADFFNGLWRHQER